MTRPTRGGGAGPTHSRQSWNHGAFVVRRCARECAESPRVRTPAQTSPRHRIPRARESLYGKPQDCSNDSPAGHCARLMHNLLPGRFRRLPVERPAYAPRPPAEFDASRPDTANHPGPLSPRPGGCASASRDFTRTFPDANHIFTGFPVPLSARIGSVRQSRSTTSGASPKIDSVHELGEHP